MSKAGEFYRGSLDSWSVLTRENWENEGEFLIRLADALGGLDGTDDDVSLYDHVEIEALTRALLPESESRAVSEVRFEYQGYEIRVTRDGLIAASPSSGGPRPVPE
ncbi:HalOD1 output domain-containing protein [Halobellus limi]|jgi:hypothetical protein|uniref:Halobacterial output domain-containing protein n=1 Tax=Halobellus limi TaxID=699433 RepID=A0A1H5X411_9EURY|nr:HalOD1 output domain-containing protein [Halobellus limi]QCC46270.1 hypothetical protein DV707_00430 [Halobellus limi]SEG06107.1 hypothetical protein SAMN04488133_1477 [Halobellus limi]